MLNQISHQVSLAIPLLQYVNIALLYNNFVLGGRFAQNYKKILFLKIIKKRMSEICKYITTRFSYNFLIQFFDNFEH